MNILDFLKKYKKGTPLYSPIFGNVKLVAPCLENPMAKKIRVEYINNDNAVRVADFLCNGKYSNAKGAECMIFPSLYMTRWDKFAWELGDVLIDKQDNILCDFGGFTSIKYDVFNVENVFDLEKNTFITASTQLTSNFEKASNEDIKLFKEARKKKEYKFKPMDWVLSQTNSDVWTLCQFSHYEDEDIVFVGGSYSPISNVLPYNEETEHLLGTKNKQK